MLKEDYQTIGEAMISGGVDNMEKYKYMMGQVHACKKISQEISNLRIKRSKQMSKNQTLETSSNSTSKIKSALLDKYDDEYKKEVDGYERLKTKESENYQNQLDGEY